MFELYDFLLLRKRLDSVAEFGRFFVMFGYVAGKMPCTTCIPEWIFIYLCVTVLWEFPIMLI